MEVDEQWAAPMTAEQFVAAATAVLARRRTSRTVRPCHVPCVTRDTCGVEANSARSLTRSRASVSRDTVRAAAAALRPKQYTKNLLLFAALLFADRAGSLEAWTAATTAFVAYCLASSASYLVNDVGTSRRTVGTRSSVCGPSHAATSPSARRSRWPPCSPPPPSRSPLRWAWLARLPRDVPRRAGPLQLRC